MIWDTFLLRDELDMLELRLAVLSPVVDRWVIVEAQTTHAGAPKRLVFPDQRHRFGAWDERIIYVNAGRLTGDQQWDRERNQRRACALGLAGAAPDDIVLHGDVDEIPDPRILAETTASTAPPYTFGLRNHVFAVDWLEDGTWPGTTAVLAADATPEMFAYSRPAHNEKPIIPGGWHFSWLGGPAEIDRKAACTTHQEWAGRIRQANNGGSCYQRGWCPWTERFLTPVEVDDTWPAPIRERKCPPSWFRPRTA